VSCQQKPTRVVSQKATQTKDAAVAAYLVTDNTVVLDTRNPFEFAANHIPGSINAQWSDFTRHSPENRGILERDSYAIAKRLALWGIDPETSVLIVGHALEGRGEEGRMAWMLNHLGVKKIKTAKFDLFRGRVTNPDEPEVRPANKENWMPGATDSELLWEEWIEKLIPYRYEFKFLSVHLVDWKEGQRVGRFQNTTLRFLDVRNNEEYNRFNLKQLDKNFPLVHRGWVNFYNENGFVRPEALDFLRSQGWDEKDEIIVISEDGVSSGAVTYALKHLGYFRARNFSGGYVQVEFEMGRKPSIPKAVKKSSKKKKK